MSTAETEIEGESLTHRILWQCCILQMEIARNQPKGAMYFHLTAMLTAYLTYEAYLNYVGERVAPSEWANEKEFFNKDPYKGIEGKLKKIAEVCGITNINKGVRPYQTITTLGDLRDCVVHGKPDKFKVKSEHPRDIEQSLHGHDQLTQLVSPEKSERAIHDIEEFVEFLHQQARKHVHDIWFGDKALSGLLGVVPQLRFGQV